METGVTVSAGESGMFGTGFEVTVKPDSVVVRRRQAWRAFYLLEQVVLCAINLEK